jgi:hypothetical protein
LNFVRLHDIAQKFDQIGGVGIGFATFFGWKLNLLFCNLKYTLYMPKPLLTLWIMVSIEDVERNTLYAFWFPYNVVIFIDGT